MTSDEAARREGEGDSGVSRPMSEAAAGDTAGAWLWPLLRCPHCMSALHLASIDSEPISRRSHGRARRPPATFDVHVRPQSPSFAMRPQSQAQAPLFRCSGCARLYPSRQVGLGVAAIPRLKRDDPLATLAHDVVVGYSDPDSLPVSRRHYVQRATRRELFLGRLLSHSPDPYAILAKRPVPEAHEPAPGESAAFERFLRLLPADGTALDLACGRGAWTWRLAWRGVRVAGLDSSAAGLALAATAGGAAFMEADMTEGAVAFMEADMMEMPLAAASMDGVWCSEAFEYVRPDRRSVFFRQVHRVLRPGGVLYLSAATKPLGALLRGYLLWRVAFGRPVVFGEYIDRLPPSLGGGWRYQAMTTARALNALCHAHGLRVLSLRREGSSWLLLARKKEG